MADESSPLMANQTQTPLRQHQEDVEQAIAPRSSTLEGYRKQTRCFLSCKWGHYLVLLLVSLDVACVFAGILLELQALEHTCGKDKDISPVVSRTIEALEIISLIFSCAFMAELLTSLWAFGISYLKDWFHCLDATVILASFIVDVFLRGISEEAGSLVIILRLFRVFKIVEELSAGAAERMDDLREEIEELKTANKALVGEIKGLKSGGTH